MVACSVPSSAELYIGLMAEPVSLPRPVKPTGHPPSPRSVKAIASTCLACPKRQRCSLIGHTPRGSARR